MGWDALPQILVRIGFNDTSENERRSLNPESLQGDFGSANSRCLAALFKELGNESSPSSLVTGANPSSIVAMEILVEMYAVAPVRIALKFFEPTIHRTLSIGRTKENSH